MIRAVLALSVLLAVQIALAVGLELSWPGRFAAPTEVAMFTIAPKDVERLTIDGADAASVVLARSDKGWVLPDLNDFPADSEQADTLLDRLLALRAGLPVATSSDALERFKLTDAAFERRVRFEGGGEPLAALYVGTGQGVRQAHARRADQDAVYRVNLAAYEVRTGQSAWIDKTLLQIPEDRIAAIEADGLRLEQADAEKPGSSGKSAGKSAGESAKPPLWQLAAETAGRKLKPEAAEALAGLVAGLNIDGVVGAEDAAEYDAATPEIELSIVLRDGATRQLSVIKAADKGDYALATTLRPELLQVSKASATALITAAGRDSLLEPAEEIQATDPSVPGSGG